MVHVLTLDHWWIGSASDELEVETNRKDDVEFERFPILLDLPKKFADFAQTLSVFVHVRHCVAEKVSVKNGQANCTLIGPRDILSDL